MLRLFQPKRQPKAANRVMLARQRMTRKPRSSTMEHARIRVQEDRATKVAQCSKEEGETDETVPLRVARARL